MIFTDIEISQNQILLGNKYLIMLMEEFWILKSFGKIFLPLLKNKYDVAELK